MANYEIKRGKAPVEQITLRLTEDAFKELFDAYRTTFPHYYAAAKKGEYKADDMMVILVDTARELGYEL